MNKHIFLVKKWLARASVAVGAAVGVTACTPFKNPISPPETVYGGPPPGDDPSIEVIEDVYGPPVVEIDSVARAADVDTVAPDSTASRRRDKASRVRPVRTVYGPPPPRNTVYGPPRPKMR